MFTKILLLYSSINLGDVAHVNAIHSSLENRIGPLDRHDIEINCDDETLLSNFTNVANQLGEEPYVIFAVGEKGSSALNTLANQHSVSFDNAYVALGIHQYYDIISKLNLDYISIPSSVLNSEDKLKTIDSIKKHSLTFAVPAANPSIDSLKASYENWDITNKPTLDAKYIVVMLPGDAPESGKMRYFTEDSADELFNDLYLLWQNNPEFMVIVENGPRTGKHDPITGQVKSTHEYKLGEEDPSVAIDDISKHFVEQLKQKEIPFQFFNFAFEISENGKSSNSVFNQLLYLAQSKAENFFIIPGESVSMLGQIPLYIFSNKAIVFKPSSMNPDHEAIFQEALHQNFVSYFDAEGNIIYPKENSKRQLDDANQVASDLIEGYNNEIMGEVNTDITDL